MSYTDTNSQQEKNPEVFPEKNIRLESREAAEKCSDTFKRSQTYNNLNRAIPSTISLDNQKKPISLKTSLKERICTEQVHMNLSSDAFSKAFSEHSDTFFRGIDVQSIPAQKKPEYEQKLAIITACFDKNSIHLKVPEREELANILIPLVGKQKKGMATSITETNDNPTDTYSFAEDPAAPLLIRLHAEGVISEEEMQTLNDIYAKNRNFEEITELTHKNLLQTYLPQITGKERGTINTNTQNFLKDFPEAKEDSQKSQTIANDVATKRIAESYIPIQQKDHSPDKVHDRSLAIRTAAKKLLLNNYTISRDTVAFETALKGIEGNDPIHQYRGLKKLIELNGQGAGQFAKLDTMKRTNRIHELLQMSYINGQNREQQRQDAVNQVEDLEKKETEAELAELNRQHEAVNNNTIDGNQPLALGTSQIDVTPGDIDHSFSQAA